MLQLVIDAGCWILAIKVTMKLKLKFAAPDFDLAMTLDSGQVFHWEKIGNGFVGTIGGLRRLCRAGRRCFESEDRGRNSCEARLTEARPSGCGIGPTLFRSRSSARGHLRFVSERPGDERGPTFLSRLANHSPAEMGMSGYVHLFVDETSGAYPADFARAPSTLW